MSKAAYPGSFNPMTLGHIDILKRGIKLFDEIIIIVANNPNKKYMFSIEERVDITIACVEDLKDEIHLPKSKSIEVIATEGIVADYINDHKIDAILRGFRTGIDIEYELQLEEYNKASCNAETIYLSPTTEFRNTSSSLVRMFFDTNKPHLALPHLSKRALKKIEQIHKKRFTN